jgi:drug/metabolite transporter (DMT)-like permease
VSQSGIPQPPGDDRSVTELVFDVSERVSVLVREEIALAKAEISEKVSSILRGGAVGIAAGIFAFLGLILLMHAIAWLIDDLFFEGSIWVGFAIEAGVFFLVAGLAGYLAFKALKKGSPPVPAMAIEEGKRIRQTLESSTTPAAKEPT